MAELADGASRLLTSWLIIRVTMPLAVTRARMFRVTPLLRLETVLAKSELPPDCAPVTACEVRVGTSWPTLMDAGMLSVAINMGAEITFVFAIVLRSIEDSQKLAAPSD